MFAIPWVFLVVQAAIVIASLLGYGIFTARPDLLMQVDPQAKFFVWAFHGFAVGNMLFGGIAVVADALLKDRLKACWAFAAVYLISLFSELMARPTAFHLARMPTRRCSGSNGLTACRY